MYVKQKKFYKFYFNLQQKKVSAKYIKDKTKGKKKIFILSLFDY